MNNLLSLELGFLIFWMVAICFAIMDLGVINRKARAVSFKAAMLWTGFWALMGITHALLIYHYRGAEMMLAWVACWGLEWGLSMDNLFVIMLTFSYFKVPKEHQHRVLFLGILAALGFRAIFIFGGLWLVEHLHPILYLFGAFLILTGVKMLREGLQAGKEDEENPEEERVIKLVKKLIPMTSQFEGEKFFILQEGKRLATPLLAALVAIELLDVVFAVDSVPAAFAITTDRFVVYTSNIMAICGLRSLFFAIAGAKDLFRYMPVGLALILIFIGVKMLIADIYKIPIWIALGILAAILGSSIFASILAERRNGTDP